MALFGRKEKPSADSASAVLPVNNPGPEIPQIGPKEEKEKKGAGAALWGGRTASSGAFGAARVGAGAAGRSGFLGSQRIASALADLFGRGSLLGGLFGGSMGSSVVLVGMLAWGGVLATAAVKFGGLGAAGPNGAGSMLALGGIGGSGIVIDRPKDRSLNYLSNANRGEMVWDKEGPPPVGQGESQEAEKSGEVEEAAQDEKPAFEMPDVAALAKAGGGAPGGKLKEGFAGKLSSSLGGASSGAGGKLQSNAFQLKTSIGQKPQLSQRGKTASFKNRNLKAANMSALSTKNAKSSRAMGQLKFANSMSKSAVGSADQGARTYSADAFDQGKSIGGEMGGFTDGGGGIVVPPGGGADGVTTSIDDEPVIPDLDTPVAVTPYQSALNAAKAQTKSAQMLKNVSLLLIAIGTAMLVRAAMIGGWGGIILAIIGAALVAGGVMLGNFASQMAANAKNMAKMIENQYGQTDQAGIVNDCADQAANNNVAVDNCQSKNPENNVESNTDVHQAVEEERNSNYTLGGGDGTP